MGTYREQQSSRYVSFPEIISARSVHPHRANSPAANFRRRRHRRRTPVARRLRSALPPVSYVKQAIVGILRRLAEFRSKTGGILDELPAFGRQGLPSTGVTETGNAILVRDRDYFHVFRHHDRRGDLMARFRIRNDARAWFSQIADFEHFKVEFDQYYLCLMAGFASGRSYRGWAVNGTG
jgi:hypothetical protein